MTLIDPEYIGQTFVQIAGTLRIARGRGAPDYESSRPKRGKSLGFSDSADTPTLITFVSGMHVDVPFLLRIGAIRRYVPPAAPTADAGEEVADGETGESPHVSPARRVRHLG